MDLSVLKTIISYYEKVAPKEKTTIIKLIYFFKKARMGEKLNV